MVCCIQIAFPVSVNKNKIGLQNIRNTLASLFKDLLGSIIMLFANGA